MPTTYWAFPPQTFTAWDANGDPVPGAKASVFEAGTAIPLTVYTDPALTTPHASPIVADANGIFAPIYISGADEIKIDITNASDVQLPGYPVDNITGVPVGGLTAAGVVFAPTATLAATEVQAALTTLDTLTQRTRNRLIEVETAGSGNAYTLDALGTITAYVDGDIFVVLADRDNTGAATLNADSVGAKAWKRHDGASYIDYVTGEVRVGNQYLVEYDSGSDEFHTIFEHRRPATQAEAEAGTAVAVTMDALRVKQAIAALESADASRITRFTAITVSGATNDFTAIAAGTNRITFMFDGASLTGTDDLVVRLGDATSFEATGYSSSATTDGGDTPLSTGFIITRNNAGGDTWSGEISFSRQDGNTWVSQGSLSNGTNGVHSAGGKTLTGELTRIRLMATGADTFDAGSVNIITEI